MQHLVLVPGPGAVGATSITHACSSLHAMSRHTRVIERSIIIAMRAAVALNGHKQPVHSDSMNLTYISVCCGGCVLAALTTS